MEMIHEAGQYVDTVKRVCDAVGGEVTFRGTVHRVRDMSDFSFVVMRVERGLIQCTFQGDAIGDIKRSDVRDAMVLEVTGAVREEPRAEHGVEVVLSAVKVLGKPYDQLPVPIGKKYMGLSLDVDLPLRPITLRHPRKQAIFRVQGAIADGFAQYMQSQGFTHIHTPKIVVAGAEGGANLFRMEYFGRRAYLAQSPQFYKQMAMAAGFERIFETGPVFRAEKSYTNKHSTEFSGFDLEFSYITSFKDVMKMEEELLTAGLKAVKENYGDQIKELFGQEVIVPTTPFPVVKLADLYKGLEEEFGYKVDESEKGDLTTEAERLSYEWVKKHYGHEFLFITDYSAEKRAFYHMRDENGVPQGYDLIWRGVEITTGAQREHRYEVLKKQAEEKGLAEDVKFYLEFFQYGCPPHGGFGLGIDRLTMLLCGLSIKDAEFLFRGPNRLTP